MKKEEIELRQLVANAKVTRRITHLFVHCTATQPTATVSAILNYWRTKLEWKNPGYHILLSTDGFFQLANFDVVCNGVKGYNANSLHISYIGGIDKTGKPKDTRTESQTQLITAFIDEVKKKYPNIKVLGHNEVSNKACPSFSVKKEFPKYWTGL
jgi:N-acetylmuramoyl-L-alanine amidase